MSLKEQQSDQALFSFGLITDTHVRAPEGDLSSPFPVNELANDRARYAARLLALEDIEFSIHLGDMVHPLPGMPAYDAACIEALDILKSLQPELYFTPGNHDVGDKPMPGLPAAAINDDALNSYEKHFSSGYYSFVKHECLFIVLNSSLINSEVQQAGEQRIWLENLLQENIKKRTILVSHYPLFIDSEFEAEHYDNLAEPGRSWLICMIRKYQIELVLSGHVHHFFYNRLDDCALYTLPPTSFTRQDYAELFRVAATAEHGRDDKGKYSVAVVDICRNGHQLRVISTDGLEDGLEEGRAEGEVAGIDKLCGDRATPATTKKNITLHLRHAWYESVDLPYNGPMEEFSRKRARNDYTFLRLQQMGIQDVRVPLQDVVDPVIRQRMQDYMAQGFRFHGFCPQHRLTELVTTAENNLHLLESFEIVISNKRSLPDPAELKLIEKKPLILGFASSGAHSSDSAKPFAHSVSSGFDWADRKSLLPEIIDRFAEYDVHGVMFQIRWEENLQETLMQMQSVFESAPFSCIANVRVANTNPAVANFDDDAIQHRVQVLIRTSESLSCVELQLDTAMDVDRGYSPRHGLIDRHGNLRPAGKWLSIN